MKIQSLILMAVILVVSGAYAKPSPNCQADAAKAVERLIDAKVLSMELADPRVQDANEKSVKAVKIVKVGDTQEETQWLIRYASVNREVGFNMEGEWEVTAKVTTESNYDGCSVLSVNAKIGLPK